MNQLAAFTTSGMGVFDLLFLLRTTLLHASQPSANPNQKNKLTGAPNLGARLSSKCWWGILSGSLAISMCLALGRHFGFEHVVLALAVLGMLFVRIRLLSNTLAC